jgi:hypothetical protein
MVSEIDRVISGRFEGERFLRRVHSDPTTQPLRQVDRIASTHGKRRENGGVSPWVGASAAAEIAGLPKRSLGRSCRPTGSIGVACRLGAALAPPNSRQGGVERRRIEKQGFFRVPRAGVQKLPGRFGRAPRKGCRLEG